MLEGFYSLWGRGGASWPAVKSVPFDVAPAVKSVLCDVAPAMHGAGTQDITKAMHMCTFHQTNVF